MSVDIKERIDIRKLVVDAPEKPPYAYFDPERDITENDWQQMHAAVTNLYIDRFDYPNLLRLSQLLANMRKINPKRDLSITEKYLEEIEENLTTELTELRVQHMQEKFAKDNWRDFAQLARNTKLIFADKIKQELVTDDDWEIMEDLFHGSKRGQYRDYLYIAMAAKILFPEKRASEMAFIDEGFEEAVKETQNYLDNRAYLDYVDCAIACKFLWPDKADEIPINDKVWVYLRNELEQARSDRNWEGFAGAVSNTLFLSAKRITLTDQGLEVEMPQIPTPLEGKIPDLPRTKKYGR